MKFRDLAIRNSNLDGSAGLKYFDLLPPLKVGNFSARTQRPVDFATFAMCNKNYAYIFLFDSPGWTHLSNRLGVRKLRNGNIQLKTFKQIKMSDIVSSKSSDHPMHVTLGRIH